MSITLIACTEINGGIGDNENGLLFDLPRDRKHFMSATSGKVVVMGRRTWDSLPDDKRPLPKRKNYVLTRDLDWSADGAKVLHSVNEVLELAKSRDVFIIGGGEIYSQFMPHADRLIMTHVHTVNYDARVFFPEIDVRQWHLVHAQKNEADKEHEFEYTFATYSRRTDEKPEVNKVVEVEMVKDQKNN
ncbi:dihydrofolate reductase [Bacillus phage Kirov]|uniref:dihydrofolate reductase n=1 Tax=Bacillus phage Kirov TaxID=2783539 RepID=A0A7U3NJT9_9CAUD|nr:dihydrofolate reductase [Bacillus phage Kirov]QOV08275.1 dihydrofolate reductase [Bacillus phage Kirov]